MSRRYRMTITPAQMREHARQHVANIGPQHRFMVGFLFLHTMMSNDEFYYNAAQTRAAAEGLMLGMDDPWSDAASPQP